jgi:hypothetical protein
MFKYKIIIFLVLLECLESFSSNTNANLQNLLPPIIQQQVSQQQQISLNPEKIINFTNGQPISIFTNPQDTTQVDFPTNIKRIVSNAENDISLEVVKNRLFIHCLDSYQGIIFVIAGGISYPLSIIQSDNVDVQVQIDGAGQQYQNIQGTFITTNSLITKYLKKLFLQECPDIIKVNKQVFQGNGISIVITKQLTWQGHFTGYIVQIINITKDLVIIPIQQISLPGLVAISVNNEVLKPQEKTKGYLLLNYPSP